MVVMVWGVRERLVLAALGLVGCFVGRQNAGSGEIADTEPGTSTGAAATTTDGGPGDLDTSTSPSTSDASGTSMASDTTAGGSSDTGSPTVEGPLVVDEEHAHFFRREGGAPFFMCGPGDPENFLHRGVQLPDGTRDGDQDEIIAKLAPTGANGIYIQAVRSHGGDGDATHNPFVAGDPAQGLSEAVLDQWDGWLGALNDAGVAPLLFIYDDHAIVWDTGDVVGAEEQAFVEALVDRFEHHPLLVWAVAETYALTYTSARVSALAAIIEAADDAHHPIASHQQGGFSFDFPDDPAIDSFAINSSATTPAEVHGGVVSVFNDAKDRYNLNVSDVGAQGIGETARAFSWAAATAGAYVMVYGQDVIGTDVADLEDCGRLVEFFGETRFGDLSPHDELATEGTTWVFARPAEAYVLFGAASPTSLGLFDLPAATWTLRWFDPALGTWIDDVLRHAGGPATLSVPPGFGTHVALYIELG